MTSNQNALNDTGAVSPIAAMDGRSGEPLANPGKTHWNYSRVETSEARSTNEEEPSIRKRGFGQGLKKWKGLIQGAGGLRVACLGLGIGTRLFFRRRGRPAKQDSSRSWGWPGLGSS